MEDETCNLYSELTWAQVKIGDPITMEGKDIECLGTTSGLCHTA